MFLSVSKREFGGITKNIFQDVFARLPVSCAQCTLNAEENPDAGMNLNYRDDCFSQIDGEKISWFRPLIKSSNLCPYKT